MLRFFVGLLASTWIAFAGAQDPLVYSVGGSVISLRGSGLQLQLWTGTCLSSGMTCVGHSTAAGGPDEAKNQCVEECCALTAFNLQATVDAQGNYTATGTCGTSIGAIPAAVSDTVLLTVSKGAHSFQFTQMYPKNTFYTVTISSQPSNPSESCFVDNGFGEITSSSVSDVVVNCDFIFANGFETPG